MYLYLILMYVCGIISQVTVALKITKKFRMSEIPEEIKAALIQTYHNVKIMPPPRLDNLTLPCAILLKFKFLQRPIRLTSLKNLSSRIDTIHKHCGFLDDERCTF